MLRTAGLLALLARALSAGFDGGISPSFQCVAAQLLGGWDLTETGLAPASRVELIWTHCLAVLFMACSGPVRRPCSYPVPGLVSRLDTAAGAPCATCNT